MGNRAVSGLGILDKWTAHCLLCSSSPSPSLLPTIRPSVCPLIPFSLSPSLPPSLPSPFSPSLPLSHSLSPSLSVSLPSRLPPSLPPPPFLSLAVFSLCLSSYHDTYLCTFLYAPPSPLYPSAFTHLVSLVAHKHEHTFVHRDMCIHLLHPHVNQVGEALPPTHIVH